MDLLRTALVAGFGLAAAGAAEAHIAITPRTAEASSYQVLRFGVGHGCEGMATTALRIEIPEGVAAARPQPKPGWVLQIEHDAEQRVSAISWRGELAADQFDEFVIQMKLPATAGPLPFPAVQTCGQTPVRWTEPPGPNGEKAKRPPPALLLTPPSAEPDHSHQH